MGIGSPTEPGWTTLIVTGLDTTSILMGSGGACGEWRRPRAQLNYISLTTKASCRRPNALLHASLRARLCARARLDACASHAFAHAGVEFPPAKIFATKPSIAPMGRRIRRGDVMTPLATCQATTRCPPQQKNIYSKVGQPMIPWACAASPNQNHQTCDQQSAKILYLSPLLTAHTTTIKKRVQQLANTCGDGLRWQRRPPGILCLQTYEQFVVAVALYVAGGSIT